MRSLVRILQTALAARRAARSSASVVGSQEWKDEIDRRRRESGRTSEYDDIEIFDDDPEFDDVELIGRGARGDFEEWQHVQTNRRLVNSSNVFAYLYVPESRTQGILYVTFLYWQQGMKPDERSGPGATYAYYDFPVAKYHQFERATDKSAGEAVWDYCRQRGTRHGHQHRYLLVQAEGDYVPRKATAKGFAPRELVSPGHSKRSRGVPKTRRSTLSPPRVKKSQTNRAEPNRAEPDRGNPDRRKPNRG